MSDGARVLPAVNMNDEINKAVQAAISVDDIKAALIAEAEKQGNVLAADQAAKDAAVVAAAAAKEVEDKAAAASQRFTRTELIGGKEFEFEAGTEAELDRVVLNAYKIAYAVQPDNSRSDQPTVAQAEADAARAQAAAEAEVTLKAELEGKYKRGEITIADYIEQSGAVDSYLSKNGVSIETLKDVVNTNADKKFEQSWADATTEFLQTGVGADWPGGARNQEMISLKIASMGLTEAPNKVEALQKAYGEMKRTNMVFSGEAAAATTTVVDAKAVQEAPKQMTQAEFDAAVKTAVTAAIAARTPVKVAASSSSLFDQSSGVMPSSTTQTPAPSADKAAALKASEGATPGEILEAWKAAQVANGIDPNSAFVDTFKAKRA